MTRTFGIFLLGLIACTAACGDMAAWNEGVPRFCGPKVFGAPTGQSFTFAFPVCGAREGLRFSVVRGKLPDGVGLDAATGILSGRAAARRPTSGR